MHPPSVLPELPHADADPVGLYEQLLRIRRVEERLIEEYGSRRLRMALHLSIGQEAVSVGVFGATRPTDTVVGTHRSHAAYLAKGGDLQAMVDEFYSLAEGCSRGRGGSMHLAAPEVGLLGSSAVLGGGVPMAVGGGFVAKRAGRGDLAVAFTGDGGIDEGSFWESLNLAALLHLPVLFVVENNGYSTLTPQGLRQASTDVVAKSEAFGVPAASVDGNDVLATRAATVDAVQRVRSGSGPVMLETTVFRYTAHVGVVADWGSGRPAEMAETWSTVDPLAVLRARAELDPASLAPVEQRVADEVDAVFARSIESFERVNALAGLEAPPPPHPSRV